MTTSSPHRRPTIEEREKIQSETDAYTTSLPKLTGLKLRSIVRTLR